MAFLRKQSLLQKIELISFCFLLISCSTASNTTSNNVALISTPKADAYNDASINAGKVLNVNNLLRIQSDGLDCSPDLPYVDGAWNGGLQRAIVLAPDFSLTYDAGEVKEMKTYINSIAKIASGSNVIDNVRTNYADLVPIPKTLQFVSMSIPIVSNKETTSYAPGCGGILEITNTGDTRLSITQLNLRLTTPITPNSNDYRLINICPLVTTLCPPQGHGGSGSLLSYHFQLGTGKVGTMFQGQLSEISPQVTIRPGEVVLIDIVVNSPANRIYSLIPEITIDTSGAHQTFDLSPLAVTFAFADTNHISCYELWQDYKFIRTNIKINIPKRDWCI